MKWLNTLQLPSFCFASAVVGLLLHYTSKKCYLRFFFMQEFLTANLEIAASNGKFMGAFVSSWAIKQTNKQTN
jgi:hypothetical protein